MSNTAIKEKRGADVFKIDVTKIDFLDGYNERKDYGNMDELTESIKENGVIIPIMVKRNPEIEGRYFAIRGHRRVTACKRLLESEAVQEIFIQAFTVPRGWNEIDLLVDQEISNSGKPLNMIERAEIVGKLLKYGLSEKEIATKLIKSSSFISNCLLLLEAPHSIKTIIIEGKISSQLVIDIFKKEKSFDEAVNVIQKLNESLLLNISTDGESVPKKKITNKNVLELENKHNSVGLAKKVIKTSFDKVIRADKKELFEFAQQLINGDFSKQQLEEMFFEPAVDIL